MDLCGRYIVAYRLGTEINATLVSDTVRDAFAHEKERSLMDYYSTATKAVSTPLKNTSP